MTKSVQLLHDIIALKSNGEERKEQAIAVEEIDKCITTDTNLLLEAPTGSGKALHVSTPILTSKGWSTMGELKAGDKIYGTQGQLINVVQAHDPFTSESVYAVTFSNGETFYADREHLWTVFLTESPMKVSQKEPVNSAETVSKKLIYVNTHKLEDELNKEYYVDLNTVENSIPIHYIHEAAMYCTPVMETEDILYLNHSKLYEQVYLSFRNREHTWETWELDAQLHLDPSSVICVPGQEALDFEHTKLPVPSLFMGEWLGGNASTPPIFTRDEFYKLQELNITTNSNGIPDIYKFAGTKHREFLLRGLMKGKGDTFVSSFPALAQDVVFLARSLGYAAIPSNPQPNIYSVKIDTERKTLTSITKVEKVQEEGITVRCITVDSEDHLFLAGTSLTPTHNTLSYLIPLVNQGTRAVISTATIQLSEQIIREDVVFLNKALKELGTSKRADVTLLKGRDNYLCLAKQAENKRISDNENTLFGSDGVVNEVEEAANKMGLQVRSLANWADETESGDRTEAPAVEDSIWRQFSSSNVECPGKSSCPFGEECFAEIARAKAQAAPIVVTNHAIVAADLATEGKLLGDRDVFVFDELHELDNYMSSAWGAELSQKSLQTAVKLFKNVPSLDTEHYEKLKDLSEGYKVAVMSVKTGLIEDGGMSSQLERFLDQLLATTTKIVASLTRLEKEASTDSMKRIYSSAKKTAGELRDTAERLVDPSVHNVRWTEDKTPRKPWVPQNKRSRAKNLGTPKEEDNCLIIMKAAPLRIGPKLQSYLTEREAIMLGLSATITVGGSMNIPLHTFGLENKKNHTVILDTPYDYKKQAMLYIPDDSFPLPVGDERNAHIEAVKESSTDFIKAAGGRALVLSTTTDNAKAYGDHYKKKLKTTTLTQGDGPNSQLISQFKEEYNTTLVGTMGFWHGLDAPGSTLILVVIDKIPFPSPSEPLLLARKNYADQQGRDGFMEIYGSQADWMARQGMGRGIRSKNDRVVIAFYDRRLITKNYGRAIIANMYGIGLFRNKENTLQAMGRLAEASEKQEKSKK